MLTVALTLLTAAGVYLSFRWLGMPRVVAAVIAFILSSGMLLVSASALSDWQREIADPVQVRTSTLELAAFDKAGEVFLSARDTDEGFVEFRTVEDDGFIQTRTEHQATVTAIDSTRATVTVTVSDYTPGWAYPFPQTRTAYELRFPGASAAAELLPTR